jgi:Fe-S-cluster formation regulator IscX/YfhJ
MADQLVPVAAGIGINLVSRLINPGQRSVTRNRVEAQRLEELGAPNSSYGYPIRELLGVCKVEGCSMIWARPLREEITTNTTTQTVRQGKGMGGSRQTTITETETATYYMTAAFLIGGPINRLERVWANGVQIWNRNDNNEITNAFGGYTEIYFGDQTQPSPTIVFYEGEAPTLKGWSYIVFDDYPIELYKGSGFPKIDIELYGKYTATDPERLNFNDAVTHITSLAGIDSTKVNLNDASAGVVMYGATFNNNGETYASYLDDLANIHGWDYYEVNGTLVIYNRQNAPYAIQIPLASLGTRNYAEELSDPYVKQRLDPLSLPSEVNVEFLSRTKELARNNVSFQDPTASHSNASRVTTRIVTNEQDMVRVASRLLYQAKAESLSITDLYLLPCWAGLRVGDFIGLQEKEVNRIYRITEIDIAEDYRVKINAVAAKGSFAVAEDNSVEISEGSVPVIAVDTSFEPPPPPSVGTATLLPLDIPLIRDADADGTLYVVVSGDSNWIGGGIYLSRDGGASYQQVASSSLSSITGTVATATPAGEGIDATTVIRVSGVNGQLSSVTQAKFDLNEGLLFLIGDEIIMARDATLVGEGVYDLSYLRRGCRGTEWANSIHSASEQFVLLSGPLVKVQLTSDDIGAALRLKAVGLYGSEPVVTSFASITFAGINYRPYAPINLAAIKDQGGNIVITWQRRDRHDGWKDVPTTFSEDFESYSIDIIDISVTTRTLSSGVSSAPYTAEQQIEDFGGLQSSILVDIYQISPVVGLGTPATETLVPVLGELPPTVTGFSPTQGVIGAEIAIYGTGFTSATTAAINGTPIDDFVVVDDGTITGTIATGTTTGKITVTNSTGTGESLADFVVVEPSGQWGTITGEISNQTDLYDILFRTRIYSYIVGGFTVPPVNGTVDVTVLETNFAAFTETIPFAIYRGSDIPTLAGVAQLVCIAKNGNVLTLKREDIGIVSATTFLDGDIIAPIFNKTSDLYGSTASLLDYNLLTAKVDEIIDALPKSKNIQAINALFQLALDSAYFQFLTPTVASVIVRLPVVTGTDYFECEIVNISTTNAIVVQESDGTAIVTLENANDKARSIYAYWNGATWQVWIRGYY